MDTLTLAVIALGAIAAILGMILWFRSVRHENVGEPIIELERLVNCRSCGSLIPEGVRKCAFCGAWQHRGDSSGNAGTS